MHTIHISAEDTTLQKILKYIDDLSGNGEKIELLDVETLTYEKNLIDQSLKEAAEGKIISLKDLKKELGL